MKKLMLLPLCAMTLAGCATGNNSINEQPELPVVTGPVFSSLSDVSLDETTMMATAVSPVGIKTVEFFINQKSVGIQPGNASNVYVLKVGALGYACLRASVTVTDTRGQFISRSGSTPCF